MVEKLIQNGEILLNKPIVTIESSSGWRQLELKKVWDSRNLIKAFLVRDLKSRFRKTAIGPLWFIVGPLLNMALSSFVFGNLAKFDSNGLPYPIFFFSAFLPWRLFKSSMEGVNNSLRDFMPYLSKVYIPHLIAPIIAFITSFIDWLISFVILIAMMFIYHIKLPTQIYMLPIFILVLFLTSFSIGLIGSAFTVRYRDVSSGLGFLLTAWYYFTPIIYSASIIPENYLWLYKLNPMFWVVEGFRWSLLGTGTPPQPEMFYPIGFFLLLFILSLYIFTRSSRNIVDFQ
jgi:lipopolysaccharide transport system permease protein